MHGIGGSSEPLQQRVVRTGHALAESLNSLLASLPGAPHGPVNLARALGTDKVFASRLLKAARQKDPIAVLQLIPGPEPIRRALKAIGRRNAQAELISAVDEAVARFEELIRQEAGDRSGLEALLSAWLPDSRKEFELRRKQAAFRAMSQLKGAVARVNHGAVLLHPAADGRNLDVVWLFGLMGLQRLRPGAAVKFASRRLAREANPRRPRTLDGESVDGLDGLRLTEFCSRPLVDIAVHRTSEIVHYSLGTESFGPRSAADLVFAEVNLAEMARFVPVGSRRKRYVFAEISTPVEMLIFDALVYDGEFPTADPTLHIYDTVLDGIADVNDPARDIDRLDCTETVQPLGRGLARFRTAEAPRYDEMLQHVCDRLGWDGNRFRGYRCRIEYPIYGSQVVLAFDAPTEPPSTDAGRQHDHDVP